jgi:uncharacterized membrane protein YagU involved in acid resistance
MKESFHHSMEVLKMTYTHSVAAEETRLDWQAALWAGLIAGVVFMMMEMILVATAGGGSAWGPPRMIAAILMGQEVLPPPATFDLGIFATAMAIHFALSVILALVLAWVISRWHLSTGLAVAAGAVFGAVVYLVNFYPVASALFPWFGMARNWITISSHVVFGIVVAWSYKELAARSGHTPRAGT